MLKPGSDCNSYYHELFLRGRPDLAEIMTRLTNADKKVHNPHGEPDFYDMAKRFPLPEKDPHEDQAPNGGQQLAPRASEPNPQLDDSGKPSRAQLTYRYQFISNEREAMYRDQERFMYPSYPYAPSYYHPEYANRYPEDNNETWQYPYQQPNGYSPRSYSYDQQANQHHFCDPSMQRSDHGNIAQWHQGQGYNNDIQMAHARTDHVAYATHIDRSQRTNSWGPYATGSFSSPGSQSLAQNHSFAEDIPQPSNTHFLPILNQGSEPAPSKRVSLAEATSSTDHKDSKLSKDSKRSEQNIEGKIEKSDRTKKARILSYGLNQEAKEDTSDGNLAVNLLDKSTYSNEPYWM